LIISYSISRVLPTPRLLNRTTVHEFLLFAGSSELRDTVRGRTKAVRCAKELSEERRGSVRVVRTDRRCKMVFRDGQLVEYMFDKHGRRS